MFMRTSSGLDSRSAPATVAVPAVGLSSVVSMRSVVVLPAPFGPRKPTISPSPTVRSTPRTASTVRLRLRNVRARPSASIIGILVSFLVVAARVVPVVRQLGQDRGELVVPSDLGLHPPL